MDFSKATELNSSETEISINNHFKLYAGPGAGKTAFLVNHINKILKSSERLNKSRKVACITYTNIGVNTLKKRLKDAVLNIEINTIHSFLYHHIIKPYLWLLKECPFPVEKLNGHDEIVLSSGQLYEFKRRSQQQYISNDTELVNALNKLTWIIKEDKVELGFINIYHGKVDKMNLKKDSYNVYKEICWENGLLSHDDVLYFSYLLLKQEENIKEVIRAKFPYILIDEFQDTSPIQVEILKMIAEKEATIGVIGDPCQSIFSFQGADVSLFNTFILEKMSYYYLRNNHRSTHQIINLLNHFRAEKNFEQKSPKNNQGELPCLLIGAPYDAYSYLKNEIQIKDLHTLAYRNKTVKAVEADIPDELNSEQIDLISKDKTRGWRMFFIIKAIEYGRQLKITEAMNSMKKAYRDVDEFTERYAFVNLKRLLDKYNEFSNICLTDFYNNFIFGNFGVKRKISSGKIKEFYDGITYERIAVDININDDLSKHKTIHQSKGDEFDNVLVILPEKQKKKHLNFLIDPNMQNEEHRVYYVALSRAKKRLFINIPNMSKSVRKLVDQRYVDYVEV